MNSNIIPKCFQLHCSLYKPRAVINPAETHPHPKQQEKNKKEAEVQSNNRVQEAQLLTQVRPEEENHAGNQDQDLEEENHIGNLNQHAEEIWSLATELGVTTKMPQRNYVQQIVEMEKRDNIEAVRLGSKMRTQ